MRLKLRVQFRFSLASKAAIASSLGGNPWLLGTAAALRRCIGSSPGSACSRCVQPGPVQFSKWNVPAHPECRLACENACSTWKWKYRRATKRSVKEFRDTGKPDLSYEDLCRLATWEEVRLTWTARAVKHLQRVQQRRSQTQGRRELIAGCFFELLARTSKEECDLSE